MAIKIVVPTNIWEFEPIIRNWTHLHLVGFWNFYELIFEQGEAPSGRNVRQKYTDLYADTNYWVMFHDHDNLISPELINWLWAKFDDKTPKIYMFGQIWWANGIKRLNAKPENCVPCKCDISQLLVHGSFLKDMVWSSDYENDGQFIQELYRRYPNDFVFVNGVHVWYNALAPGKGLYNGQIITIA